jgi:hypothetical protein
VVVYTVHEPPSPPADRGERADRSERAEALVFIRDGFSWGAALVPSIWLILRGEWLALAAYTAAVAVLAGVLAALGAQADWVALSVLAFNVLFGFEASELRGWLLARSGWRQIATVSGKTREECERRFFDAWLEGEPLTSDRNAPGRPEVRSLTGGWLATHVRDWSRHLQSRFDAKA